MVFTGLLGIHLIGLAIGLGGATIADIALLRSVLTRRPVPVDQLRDLSWVIWLGVAVLTLSGLLLFALSPSSYLHNSGFIAKMVIVGLLILNGAVLHGRITTFRVSLVTLLCGAVSIVSWYGSLIIAMYKSKLHLTVPDYLSLYLLAVVVVWRVYCSLFARLHPSGHEVDSPAPRQPEPAASTHP
jgi:hypothetical protein